MDKYIETVKQMIADGQVAQDVAEKYFPELKESEDESIKRDIQYAVRCAYGDNSSNTEKILAWIERQGEQKPVVIIPKFRVGDVIHLKNSFAEYTIKSISDGHYYGDGFSFNIVGCDRDYELVKQKPTNKVETKFKVCDKIRRKDPSSFDTDMQVARIDKGYYICNRIGKFSSEVVPFSEESSYELIEQIPATWLGKHGEPAEINSEFDSQLNRLLEKFKSLPKEELASSLSFYLNVVQNDGTYKIEDEPNVCEGCNNAKGCVACVDGSEWAHIEEAEPTWSEDDEIRHKTTLDDLEAFLECIKQKTSREISEYHLMSKDSLLAAIQKDIDWFRTLKDRVLPQPKQEWSEEDEKNLNRAIWYIENPAINVVKDTMLVEWLKALKDRVGCTTKWKPSEEQNEMIDKIKTQIALCNGFNRENRDKVFALLDALRPQKQWKPTKEQIIAIRWFLNNTPYNKHKEELSGLLEQILKL